MQMNILGAEVMYCADKPPRVLYFQSFLVFCVLRHCEPTLFTQKKKKIQLELHKNNLV